MSNCNFPTLTLPNPPDPIAAIIALLKSLIPGFKIPPLPSIPIPNFPPSCPLD